MMALLLDTCCWDGMPNYPSVCTRLVLESVYVCPAGLCESALFVLMTHKCWLFVSSPWAARSSVLWCTTCFCLLDALKNTCKLQMEVKSSCMMKIWTPTISNSLYAFTHSDSFFLRTAHCSLGMIDIATFGHNMHQTMITFFLTHRCTSCLFNIPDLTD